MNRIEKFASFLCILLVITIWALLGYHDNLYDTKELLSDQYDYARKLELQVFEYKKQVAMGNILYNTAMLKENLTLIEAKQLDSLVLTMIDSSDIIRICNTLKIENSIWLK